jgi:hypothetical protein
VAVWDEGGRLVFHQLLLLLLYMVLGFGGYREEYNGGKRMFDQSFIHSLTGGF